jgi:hypothetical protein
LEGTGDTLRIMRVEDAANLKQEMPELRRLVKGWCDERDAD